MNFDEIYPAKTPPPVQSQQTNRQSERRQGRDKRNSPRQDRQTTLANEISQLSPRDYTEAISEGYTYRSPPKTLPKLQSTPNKKTPWLPLQLSTSRPNRSTASSRRNPTTTRSRPPKRPASRSSRTKLPPTAPIWTAMLLTFSSRRCVSMSPQNTVHETTYA